MNRTPSFLRIIQVDYLASLGVIAAVVIWGMALAFLWFDPEAASFFRRIAPLVTVAGLILVFWRARMITSVITEGHEAPGVITSNSFFRGRGRVEYVFDFQGQKLIAGNAIQATRLTRSLAPGQGVTVLVDHLNPKRAFLRELYS